MQREPVKRGAGVPPKAGAFIGIDVQADGKVHIVLWHEGRADAIYAPCTVQHALARALPQALGEAVAFSRQVSDPGPRPIPAAAQHLPPAPGPGCGPDTPSPLADPRAAELVAALRKLWLEDLRRLAPRL